MDPAPPGLPALSPVAQTLIFPLYFRAAETQRPDALLRDTRAVALVKQLGREAAALEAAQVGAEVQLALILRSLEFDRQAQAFLARQPDAVVVHLGCGLDTRCERVDNGRVEWYDLDLPEVMAWRRQLLGADAPRRHALAGSALDSAWLTTVAVHRPRPLLVLAEGVFMFFTEAQVKALVLALRDRCAGAELVFDAFTPFFVWANNRRVARTQRGARCAWGLKRATDLETWGPEIRLLSAWYPFLQRTPRLAHVRWVRALPLLARATGVFHYRLGQPAP